MEFFKNKTILITGHKGFLGSWLSLLLYRKCKSIYGISHKENKNNIFNLLNLNSKIQSYCFDLNNTKKLTNFFRNKKIDIVIHLAAQAIVYEAFKNQENTIKNNFLVTLNLLSKTNHFRNMIFVNFTSDKVYENSNNKKKDLMKMQLYLVLIPIVLAKVVVICFQKYGQKTIKILINI